MSIRGRVSAWGREVGDRIPPRWHSTIAFVPVLLIAALIRLVNLDSPAELVFDEVYYVRDAWTMLNLGYESDWVGAADFADGGYNGYTSTGDFVAHPPLGKWIIALGLAAFGPANPFGWRIAVALAGIGVVVLVMVIARRLFGSLTLAALSGSLVAIDGIAITMSRTALLDGFLALFVLAAFLSVLRHLDTPGWGGWLLLAGIFLGAAIGVKWSGLYALAAFGLWIVVVETLRLRKAFADDDWIWLSIKSAAKSFILLVPVAVLVYISTWTGWIVTDRGWGRTWAADNGFGDGVWGLVRSMWKYHRDMYDYNVGLHDAHSYAASPFSWLALARPTAFYYEPVGPDGLVQYITSIANPILWWGGAAALVVLLLTTIRRPTWQTAAILVGVAATYLPWLLFADRTMFQFYTVTLEPFLILALVWAIAWAWRKHLRFVVVSYLGIAVAISAFFLPVWMGLPIPDWFAAMHYWFPSWI